MSFVFFGTPEISRTVLAILVAHEYIPRAVVTNPDRPVGRKRIVTQSPVKQFALSLGLQTQILQPEKIRDCRDAISALHPDFFIVAAYANIIPSSILSIPHLGAIGVHPSLLPLYRGPSPIQSAILDGASEVGVTLYRMDEKMDEGPILAQERLPSYRIGEKTNAELSLDLAKLGGEMLVRLMPEFVRGKSAGVPQDHSLATYTKKFSTEDAFVSPHDLSAAEGGGSPAVARAIHQKILAFTPEPGAWTTRDGKRVKLLASRIAGGRLALAVIQKEGKKPSPTRLPMPEL